MSDSIRLALRFLHPPECPFFKVIVSNVCRLICPPPLVFHYHFHPLQHALSPLISLGPRSSSRVIASLILDSYLGTHIFASVIVPDTL